MSEGRAKLAQLEARLEELAHQVRESLPLRAEALRLAADALDGDEATARATIARAAHMIRGTAASHGIVGLTLPAAEVETAAKAMSTAALREAVRVLADRLDAAARAPTVVATPSIQEPALTPSGGIEKPLRGRTILAIDDDPPTRRLLTMTLANLGGASVTVEERVDAFFAALASSRYDAVIVDAMMPETSGLACLERIAGSPLARPDVAYFVLSAATPEELRWTLPAGLAVDWLRKPFRPRELLDALRVRLGA